MSQIKSRLLSQMFSAKSFRAVAVLLEGLFLALFLSLSAAAQSPLQVIKKAAEKGGTTTPSNTVSRDSAGGQKYALLVGINAYQRHPLNGCVKDAMTMKELLIRRFGYAEENIEILTDTDATRNGILQGFARMRQKVREGDSFLFYYSGHGTVFPDQYSEVLDETEDIEAEDINPATSKPNFAIGKYDSAICPIDIHDPSTSGKRWGNLILDDELYDIFMGFTQAGVFVTLLSDSCHSGSLARTLDVNAPVSKGIPFYQINGTSLTAIKGTPTTRRINSATRDAAMQGNYVALTASKDTQTSQEADVDGQRRGIFTLSLQESVMNPAWDGTIAGLAAMIDQKVKARGYKQVTQLDTRFFKSDPAVTQFLQMIGGATVAYSAKVRVVVRIIDAQTNEILSGATFAVIKPGLTSTENLTPQDTLFYGITDSKGLFDSQSKMSRSSRENIFAKRAKTATSRSKANKPSKMAKTECPSSSFDWCGNSLGSEL